MTTMIAIPAGRAPSWGLLKSLWGLRHDEEVILLWTPALMRVDDARNWLASRFLESNADWLLWLDSDATIPPGTIKRLQSWNKSIVGALCFNRRQPIFPVAYAPELLAGGKYAPMYQEVKDFINHHPKIFTNDAAMLENAPPGALLPVSATGCHCLMTAREVYEALEPPFFKVRDGEPWHGEDTYFLENAKKAGFDVFVDLSILSGHMAGTERSIGVVDFIASSYVTTWKEA